MVKTTKMPQATRRALFYHCSWAAEIFQQLMHIENCVRNVFVSIKILINRKNNLYILQTTSKTLFCYTLLVAKIFQQIGRSKNCVRATFLHSVTVWNQLVVWKRSGFANQIKFLHTLTGLRHLLKNLSFRGSTGLLSR